MITPDNKRKLAQIKDALKQRTKGTNAKREFLLDGNVNENYVIAATLTEHIKTQQEVTLILIDLLLES